MEKNQDYSETNLYHGVRGIAVKILNRIDRTDAYLDKMLATEIKNSELNGVDKALLFEIVHGVIRWMGRFDWILNGFYKGQFSKCIPNVKNAMRVALYQILFLDKVPDYAAVNEAVEFVKRLQGKKPADLTNAVLRNIIRNKSNIRYPKPEEDIVNYLSAYYSHPSWLVKRWVNRYGEGFTKELVKANNNKPVLSLRVNQIKSSVEELSKLLAEVDLKFTKSKYFNNFLRLNTLSNITDWEYFKKGYFTIQDESTAFSCHLLDVKPHHKVLDVCAAPGGKTALLADLMNNEGDLVALDKYDSRLKILKNNLERLGVSNVRAIPIDANEFEERDFDRVLLDAPCTGLGTLTKKPDIKWKRDYGDIYRLNKIQSELLETASKFVKPGGVLVYSTCTIEPEENINMVKSFLEKNPEFKLEKPTINASVEVVENDCIQTYPNIHKFDGAFAAKLIKQ